jgi:aldehyde:ferredoxin oxidoreductase
MLQPSRSSQSICGYHGCYLRVDLSAGRAERVELAAPVLRNFIGGSGLGTHLLLAEGAAGVDPLAPEAPLAFVFSPLVGSPLTTSAKFAVLSKSPLTLRINDALSSSRFALAGKQSGCDAIVLVGRIAEPSVVLIDDGCLKIEPARELWGMNSDQVESALRARIGSAFQVAAIGPAGERLVRYATLSHDGRHAGRGGSGAVLGSKNVKAIAVRGTSRCAWAQPQALLDLATQLSQRSFSPATAKYRELGTAANLLVLNRLAALPTCNFQSGRFSGVESLAPETWSLAREKVRRHCASCTIGCEHIYSLAGAAATSQRGVRVEYENLFALGPLCGIDDPNAVLEASRRCDELGMDTISTGGTIAFAMECAARGLLHAPWLRFGDGRSLRRAIELIARRDGLGDLLAEGSRRMAVELGHDTIQFAPQVKGLEIPGYEPRAMQTMALGFAVAARGADHNRSGAYEVDLSPQVDRRHAGPEAAALAIETENKAALMDSLILCKFLRGVFQDFYAEAAEMLQLVTGWETTPSELRRTAERIVTAKKQFNILAGWTPEEDTLPQRMLQEALPDDEAARLSPERLGALVRAYNTLRGWSPEGWISPRQLAELNG